MDLTQARLRRVATADPAAGASASIPNPGPHTSTLVCLSFQLATDANAANRIVDILNSDGSTARIINGPLAIVTANTTLLLTYGTTANYKITTSNPRYDHGLPLDIFVPAAGNITIQVTGIQAGDQISEITSWWKIFY